MGMLANRLRRMYRHLRKWARRTEVSCFRLYEKDIPEHPLIVDWYDGRALAYAMHRKRDETPEARQAWLAGARRNFELNALDPRANTLERADILTWLPGALASGRKWDLIVCDPPTFSNSKKMQDFFDVGARHPELVNACLRLLSPGGIL